MSMLRVVLCALLGLGGAALAVAEELRFSLVRTAQTESQADYAWRNGGWQQPLPVDHVALLIEHRGVRLLFGTGLGRQIDAQWDAVMPWRTKRYGQVRAVRDQLERDGLHIDRILLGCPRWDHASGLADYPELPVLASPDSLHYLQAATPPAVLPSQFGHQVNWQPLQFDGGPYQGYARSADLFGDGRVVLVALDKAVLGLFLSFADGRRFFFRGDALGQPAARNATSASAGAHHARLQAGLGFYPQWVK